MNASTTARQIATALSLLALALLLAPAASAQEQDNRQAAELVVAGPQDVPLGNPARLVAVLRDASGVPMAGARIAFTSPATFAGTVAEMKLGEVATDAEGVAILDYQLRTQGQNQFIARHYGDTTYQPAQASTVVTATGQAQLVQRSAGVEMPLAAPGTLIVVLGGVWTVYFLAMLLVAGIPEPRGAQPGLETGGD